MSTKVKKNSAFLMSTSFLFGAAIGMALMGVIWNHEAPDNVPAVWKGPTMTEIRTKFDLHPWAFTITQTTTSIRRNKGKIEQLNKVVDVGEGEGTYSHDEWLEVPEAALKPSIPDGVVLSGGGSGYAGTCYGIDRQWICHDAD